MKTINSLYVSVNSFAYAGSQFLQVLWIARYYGAEPLAIFALVTGFFAPLMSFLSSGQRFSMLSNAHGVGGDFVGNFILRVISMCVFFITALSYCFIYDRSIFYLVVFLGFYKVLDGLFEVFSWRMQVDADLYSYVLVGFLRCITIPIACLVVYLLDLDMFFYFFICAIATFVFLLFICIKFFPMQTTNACSESVSGALVAASAPGAAAGLESLAIMLPRFFLAWSGNPAEVSAYVILIQMINVLGIVASATLQSDMPRFSSNVAEVRSLYYSFLSQFFFFCLLIEVFIHIMPNSFYGLLFGEWFVVYAKNMLAFLPLFLMFGYVGGYAATLLAVRNGSLYMLWYSLGLLCGVCALSGIGYFVFDFDLTVVLSILLVLYFFRWLILSVLIQSSC